jgi:hypothetical protein
MPDFVKNKFKLTGPDRARLVERLMAPKAGQHAAGYDCGARWALATASEKELLALEEFRERMSELGDEARLERMGDDHSLTIARAIASRNHETFWASAVPAYLQDQVRTRNFVRGFSDGAAAVWEAVKGEVTAR